MTKNEIIAALHSGHHVGRKREAVVCIVRLLARPCSAGDAAEWVYGPLTNRHRRVARIRCLLDGATRRGELVRTDARFEVPRD